MMQMRKIYGVERMQLPAKPKITRDDEASLMVGAARQTKKSVTISHDIAKPLLPRT